MTERKPAGPLTTGQKIALGVLGVGFGAVFLAACARAVVWLLAGV